MADGWPTNPTPRVGTKSTCDRFRAWTRVASRSRQPGAASHFGLGTASAFLNLFYGPAKVLYAALGTATGGLAWVITGGDGEVARKIVQPAVRGDYAIVPDNLTLDRPLRFVGRDPYRTYDPASP